MFCTNNQPKLRSAQNSSKGKVDIKKGEKKGETAKHKKKRKKTKKKIETCLQTYGKLGTMRACLHFSILKVSDFSLKLNSIGRPSIGDNRDKSGQFTECH